MKKVALIKQGILAHMWFICSALLIGMLLFYTSDSHATNHLASLKTDVVDTFGKGSDLPFYLLLGEGIIGAVTYMKTKNPMVLIGVPILMIFTHFALSPANVFA